MHRLALLALLLFAPTPAARAGQPASPPPPTPVQPAPATAPPTPTPFPRHELPPAPRVAVSPLAAGLDHIEKHFLLPIPRVELEARALSALLRELDPYSRYLDPGELALMADDLQGKFGGVGVFLDMDEASGFPVVQFLLHGGVAAAADVRRGDRLLEVDGVSVRGLDYPRVAAALRGPVGSPVRLRLQRAGNAEPIEVALRRAAIDTPSVRALRRDADGRPDWWLDHERRLGYARVSNLTRDTAGELEAALSTLERGRARGLVLDLRDCTGGLMRGALDAADLFIGRGRLLTVVQRGKDEGYEARRGKYTRLPLAVLINAGTASSGEILAGALKDSGRATLVGEPSFGKGRVQVLYVLGEGQGGITLSTGTFQRPNGKTIDRHDLPADATEVGIVPDVVVKMSVAEHAAWLEFAERTTGAMVLTPAEQQGAPPDPVLAKAIELLSKR